jgi:tetratricopeptide (TPR) repeat protein
VPEIEQASALLRKGDADGALKLLKEAAKKHPDLPPPNLMLAKWFGEMNQMTLVRNAADQAILEAPDDPEAYLLLADMDLRARMATEAGLLYAKALELTKAAKEASPRITAIAKRALAGLATVAEGRQDWKVAQQDLEALLADGVQDAAALQQLGRVLFRLKQPEQALERFRQAVKLDPSAVSPEAALALLYQQNQDSQTAAKWMVKAIEAAPRDARVRLAAAQWEYEIGRYDDAEKQAQAAVQLDPDLLTARLVRGMVALARKDFKTAEESFERAHLLAPTNILPVNGLALALIESRDEAKRRIALEYAQLNARQYPDQPDALSTLGWVLYRLGRLDEAEANLRKAASSSTGRVSGETLYYYAKLLADRGQKEDAKRLLQAPAIKGTSRPLLEKEVQALLEDLSK